MHKGLAACQAQSLKENHVTRVGRVKGNMVQKEAEREVGPDHKVFVVHSGVFFVCFGIFF